MARIEIPTSQSETVIPGFQVKPMASIMIECKAILFLKKYDDKFDINDFIEYDLDDIGYSLRISNTLKEDAVTNFQTREIVLSRDVYDNIRVPRNRFTIAHELGHAVLHTEELSDRQGAASRHINTLNLKAYESSEWQANQFAAAVLLPFNDIGESFSVIRSSDFCRRDSITKLAEKFEVSTECVDRRIRTLRRFSPQEIRSLIC